MWANSTCKPKLRRRPGGGLLEALFGFQCVSSVYAAALPSALCIFSSHGAEGQLPILLRASGASRAPKASRASLKSCKQNLEDSNSSETPPRPKGRVSLKACEFEKFLRFWENDPLYMGHIQSHSGSGVEKCLYIPTVSEKCYQNSNICTKQREYKLDLPVPSFI